MNEYLLNFDALKKTKKKTFFVFSGIDPFAIQLCFIVQKRPAEQ